MHETTTTADGKTELMKPGDYAELDRQIAAHEKYLAAIEAGDVDGDTAAQLVRACHRWLSHVTPVLQSWPEQFQTAELQPRIASLQDLSARAFTLL